MGFKASLIIIKNPNGFKEDLRILEQLEKKAYKFDQKYTLEECIYPRDRSISIGRYNGKLILCDDYQLTTESLDRATNLTLARYEQRLCELFPKSEIISIACHSGINYHAYSIIKNGTKVRLKSISSDSGLKEFGDRTPEEEEIYKQGFQKDGKNYWIYDSYPDETFFEDQLLEDFVYSFMERGLGFSMWEEEGIEIAERIMMNKYKRSRNRIRRFIMNFPY